MATKRKPAATAKRKAPAKRKQPPKPEIDQRWSILLYVLGVLFVLLSLIPGESAWAWSRSNILFGGFGISGWLLGPFMLYWATLITAKKPVLGPIIKGSFFMLTLSGVSLVFGGLVFKGLPFPEMLSKLVASGQTYTGGGILSIVLGLSLLLLAGRPVANILLLIIFILATMLLTNITPAHVVRFFRDLVDRFAGPEYDDDEYYEDEYDEEYEEEEEYIEERMPRQPAKRAAPVRQQPLETPQARRPRGPVDIPLGPAGPVSQPGASGGQPVEIGPGGTFGLNSTANSKPAEPVILPFDASAPLSSFEEEEATAGEGILLFGEDDPYAHLGGAQSKLPRGNLFDVEYIAPPADPEFDLFGNPMSGTAVGSGSDVQAPAAATAHSPAPLPPVVPGEESTPSYADAGKPVEEAALFETGTSHPGVPLAGEVPVEHDANVTAMIDRAAALKAEETPVPGGSRPAATSLRPYEYPPLALFDTSPPEDNAGAREEMKRTADSLVGCLASFGVQTRILDVSRGPSVTRYEIQPQAGVKISRITGLADDIALNLAAAGVRIEAPIPGKPAVGIEVPNQRRGNVGIRSLLESASFTASTSPLSIALGKDIAGEVVVADLTKMPHLLIAGSTGSGKSVCVNATIMSFLYKSAPEDMRLLLIDPKVVELAEYNGIPHLLMPVVTEPRKAANALGAAVAEMERRYHLFAEYNVRDIKTFNKLVSRSTEMEKLPYIAIVIDELADLMMTAGKEVEDYICRIAQKARAAGMHLIVATQRPSVDVITGLIKANIPSRIAFAVSSQVDSRTILDGAGAEKLLGSGDMLFMPVGANKPVRVQGTYVKDKEISSVLRFLKQSGEVQYDSAMIEEMDRRTEAAASSDDGGSDDMLKDQTFRDAVETALEAGKISTSFLQRRLRLGYARAGRIMDEMERLHIVGPPEGSKPREVLISYQQWLEMSINTSE